MSRLESPASLDIRSPEELREAYPGGMYLYYQPDESRMRIHEILTATFPQHLIVVMPGVYSPWPADSGMQIGKTLYSDGSASSLLYKALSLETSLTPEDIYSLLPVRKSPNIEGGHVVPIPGSNSVFYGGLWDMFATSTDVFAKEGMESRYVSGVASGLYRLKCGIVSQDMSRKWVEKLARDWVFGTKTTQHLDLVFSGVGTDLFLDKPLLDYTRQINMRNDPFLDTVMPFPHECTLLGGLNIQYVWSGEQCVALVRSFDAIGPLAHKLLAAGYRIVELGDDQVRDNGGVKCRSLVVRWRDVD